MEAKLKQLDQEKEELAKYQRIDKERRSLEYTIYEKERLETQAKLEKVWPLHWRQGPLGLCRCILLCDALPAQIAGNLQLGCIGASRALQS